MMSAGAPVCSVQLCGCFEAVSRTSCLDLENEQVGAVTTALLKNIVGIYDVRTKI